MSKIYLYLARRDKKGVRILLIINGSNQAFTRVSDLKLLNLPTNVYNNINSVIFENRMLWEPWVESADSFEAFRKHLDNRGFSGLPLAEKSILNNKFITNKIDLSSLPKRKTMIRKSK